MPLQHVQLNVGADESVAKNEDEGKFYWLRNLFVLVKAYSDKRDDCARFYNFVTFKNSTHDLTNLNRSLTDGYLQTACVSNRVWHDNSKQKYARQNKMKSPKLEI